MKKCIMLLIIFSFIIVLVGCNNNEKKIEDIINSSIEASKTIKSYHITEKSDSNNTINGVVSNNNAINEMDFVRNPLSFYLEINNNPYAYYKDEILFINDSTSNQWECRTSEDRFILIDIFKQQDLSLTLEQLIEVTDKLTLDEDEKYYILSFVSTSAEDNKEILRKEYELRGGFEGVTSEEVLKSFSLNSIKSTYKIEKKTYLITQINSERDLSVNLDNFKHHSVSVAQIIYSKYNEIEKIIVPEEIKDQAVDISY